MLLLLFWSWTRTQRIGRIDVQVSVTSASCALTATSAQTQITP